MIGTKKTCKNSKKISFKHTVKSSRNFPQCNVPKEEMFFILFAVVAATKNRKEAKSSSLGFRSFTFYLEKTVT